MKGTVIPNRDLPIVNLDDIPIGRIFYHSGSSIANCFLKLADGFLLSCASGVLFKQDTFLLTGYLLLPVGTKVVIET